MGCRGAWRFRAPPWRVAPGTPVGWVPVGGRSKVSKSGSGMGRSKPTALWVIDGVVGLDEAGIAGGGGDAGLAAAVDGVQGGGLGRGADRDAQVDVAQVADRAGEFEFAGLPAQ